MDKCLICGSELDIEDVNWKNCPFCEVPVSDKQDLKVHLFFVHNLEPWEVDLFLQKYRADLVGGLRVKSVGGGNVE